VIGDARFSMHNHPVGLRSRLDRYAPLAVARFGFGLLSRLGEILEANLPGCGLHPEQGRFGFALQV
jgi:hypothetical protein